MMHKFSSVSIIINYPAFLIRTEHEVRIRFPAVKVMHQPHHNVPALQASASGVSSVSKGRQSHKNIKERERRLPVTYPRSKNPSEGIFLPFRWCSGLPEFGELPLPNQLHRN